MSRVVIFFLCVWLVQDRLKADAFGNTNAVPPPVAPETPNDPGAESRARVPGLYQSWKAEHDPAKRADLSDQLLDAIMHCYANPPIDIADEIAREGLPRNLISPPAIVKVVPLAALTTLNGVHSQEWGYPPSLVFRRITAHRLEAWTSSEGRLFDETGKVLVDVHVPRRDGVGREWFGAFLPNGTWITTDIWANDEQVNCYTPSGKWKWELRGAAILAGLPKPDPNEAPRPPLIDWGRSDKTGRRWLVSVGANLSREIVLVDQTGQSRPIPDNASTWQMVYPRAMGIRGGYVAFNIDSDDAKRSLGFVTVAHGPYCLWPIFNLSGAWGETIYAGTTQFGFWPHSHNVYVEVPARVPEPWHTSPNTWFFEESGKYQGEIAGSYLADASNGRDLLLKDGQDHILQVASRKTGISVANVRNFTWPDGTQAVPLAVYDDLRLGFFLRGSGITGLDDDARRARAVAEVVLAKWKD